MDSRLKKRSLRASVKQHLKLHGKQEKIILTVGGLMRPEEDGRFMAQLVDQKEQTFPSVLSQLAGKVHREWIHV
jgi:hypothetical protein